MYAQEGTRPGYLIAPAFSSASIVLHWLRFGVEKADDAIGAEVLEPFMVTRRRFCFSDGAAIREEGGIGQARPTKRVPASGNPSGRALLGQILRASSRPYPDTTVTKALDPDPKSLRQNVSV